MLDRAEMDSFAEIFLTYQKRGKATDEQGGQLFHFAGVRMC